MAGSNTRRFQGDTRTHAALLKWRRWGFVDQSRSRVSQYWNDKIRADPYLRDVHMVIALVFGDGTTIRVATEDIESVSIRDTTTHDALPLLMGEPDLPHTYHFGDGTSAGRSLTFTLNTELIKPSELIRRGHALAGYGEVSLEVPNGDYDERLVLIRGDMTGEVRFGANKEAIEIEITDPKESVDTRLPPWVIDADRFSGVHETAVGERTPIVINGFDAIPCPRVNSVSTLADFLFAYGHGWVLGEVRYNGTVVPDAGNTQHDLIETEDDFGIPVSIVRFTQAAFFSGLQDSDAVHVSTTHTTERRHVVDVIRRIVEEFTPLGRDGVHDQLFTEARAKIGETLVERPKVLVNKAGGSGSTNALQWIEQGYLDSFPLISMVWRDGRYGPVVTDRRAAPVADLEVGTGMLVDRVALISETPKSAISNDFVLRYDYDIILDQYRSVLQRNQSNSSLCSWSVGEFGERTHDVIESPYIHDDALASLVIDWLVEHLSIPSYFVVYEAYAPLFLRLRRGDTVKLTDAEINFNGDRATVESLNYRRGRCEVMFRVWPGLLDLGGAALSYARSP